MSNEKVLGQLASLTAETNTEELMKIFDQSIREAFYNGAKYGQDNPSPAARARVLEEEAILLKQADRRTVQFGYAALESMIAYLDSRARMIRALKAKEEG